MWSRLKGKFPPILEPSKGPKTVGLAVGYFMVLNYVVGNGFLGIPFTFYHAGMVGSITIFLFIMFMEWNSARWLFEVMSRAQALETFKQEQLVETQSEKSDHLPALSDRSHVTPDDHPKYEILVTRKFELTELCQVFVGRWFKVFYLLVVITASFIVLWTYSTVAGSAWSTNLPLNFGPLRMCTEEEFQDNIYPKGSGCLAAYRFCVFLFAVVVLPLSLLDLKNVGVIQTIFGGLRFAIIGAMVLYALFNLGIGGLQGGVPLSANGTESNLTGNVLSDFVYGFSFTGWLSAIALFTSALIIHPGLSTLTHPIKNKKPLGWFVLSIYGTVAVFYVLMGVILTLWFGSDVNSTITLNWVPSTKSDHSVAIRVLSYFIILVPSIISAYPLVVYFTSNNIYLVLMGKDTSQKTSTREWVVLVLIKAIFGVLPLIVALFVSNLIFILKYAGLVAFLTSALFPGVLQLTSQRKCAKVFGGKREGVADSQPTPSTGLEMDTIKREEGAPLMEGEKADGEKEASRMRKDAVYTTPYSLPVLSHPIAAIVQLAVAGVLFVAACASIAYRK
eukprot:Em0006g1277a